MRKLLILVLAFSGFWAAADDMPYRFYIGGESISPTESGITCNTPPCVTSQTTGYFVGAMRQFPLGVIVAARIGLEVGQRTLLFGETGIPTSQSSFGYKMTTAEIPAQLVFNVYDGWLAIFGGANIGFALSSSGTTNNWNWTTAPTFSNSSPFFAPRVGLDLMIERLVISPFYEFSTTYTKITNYGTPQPSYSGSSVGAMLGIAY